MNDGVRILDIRELDIKLLGNLCNQCEMWLNSEKINIIREFNSAPRFSVFLKSLFFSISNKTSKTGYINYFLKNGGMGKAAVIKDSRITGIALYGSYCLFPALKQFAIYPPDFESAFLGCVCIDEDFSEFGIGERLLLSVEKDLIERQYKSVETIAKRANDDLSEEDFARIHFFNVKFLISKGFYIKKNDELYPLLRLDLSNIITVPEEESWLYKLFIRNHAKRSSVTEACRKK
ncbi:MAG TPA: hypothetical protein GXZ93_07310 [Actinobacteria bacterium]|jgi:ribosomal protein S18 acetylase RimI-like enzyme|nr:hypothetical protein [Actinomycetota bacterium]